MTQLEGCIRFHEELLRDSRIFMSVSAVTLEEETIKYLKALKALVEKGEATE